MFNPIQSIKSRYSKTISSHSYSTITLSGSTILIGNKGGNGSGYIYAPYIIMESNSIIIDRETIRKELRAKRKEKLKKLGWS